MTFIKFELSFNYVHFLTYVAPTSFPGSSLYFEKVEREDPGNEVDVALDENPAN